MKQILKLLVGDGKTAAGLGGIAALVINGLAEQVGADPISEDQLMLIYSGVVAIVGLISRIVRHYRSEGILDALLGLTDIIFKG